jgi:hypothetical protein
VEDRVEELGLLREEEVLMHAVLLVVVVAEVEDCGCEGQAAELVGEVSRRVVEMGKGEGRTKPVVKPMVRAVLVWCWRLVGMCGGNILI